MFSPESQNLVQKDDVSLVSKDLQSCDKDNMLDGLRTEEIQILCVLHLIDEGMFDDALSFLKGIIQQSSYSSW